MAGGGDRQIMHALYLHAVRQCRQTEYGCLD